MNWHASANRSDTVHYLQQLQVLRALVWLAQTLALLLGQHWLSAVQFYTLAGLLVLQLLVLGVGHARLLHLVQQDAAPGERELLLQLLVDVLTLTGVLYVAGGATNPFVSYYLVPIALAAATLPRRHTILLAAFCLLASGWLLFHYLPLQMLSPEGAHSHHGSDTAINGHVLGMWLNVCLSALLIAHFVTRIAATVRRQREAINRLREQQLMDENILSVATLAAGAAHEMGTPLASLAVLLGDLRQERTHDAALQADLQLMQDQVGRCRQSLQQLADTAREHQAGSEQRQSVAQQSVAQWVERLVRNWQLLRPEVTATFAVEAGPVRHVALPLVVEKAVINVLNNAADASDGLQVGIAWDTQALKIEIADNGPGIAKHVLQQRGQVKTSDKGMGIGLLLSHASLDRAGGVLSLLPRPEGGTLTRIVLPLKAVEEEA